jgi:hypothetical protein
MSIVKGKYIVTAKFNKEIRGIEEGLVLLKGDVPAVLEPAVPKDLQWKDLYLRFILESNVPKRIVGPNGEPYSANMYSDPGMKAFRKAIEREGINYPKLVAATKLYYQSSVPYKVSIGRYMEEEMWRTGYTEISAHLTQGTLEQHLKETKHEHFSRYKPI